MGSRPPSSRSRPHSASTAAGSGAGASATAGGLVAPFPAGAHLPSPGPEPTRPLPRSGPRRVEVPCAGPAAEWLDMVVSPLVWRGRCRVVTVDPDGCTDRAFGALRRCARVNVYL